MLNCYIICIILSDSKCRRFPHRREENRQWCGSAKGCWAFHDEQRGNFKEHRNKKDTYTSIRKRKAKFLGHIMLKKDLKNLTLTGHFKGKMDRVNKANFRFFNEYAVRKLPSFLWMPNSSFFAKILPIIMNTTGVCIVGDLRQRVNIYSAFLSPLISHCDQLEMISTGNFFLLLYNG